MSDWNWAERGYGRPQAAPYLVWVVVVAEPLA